MQNSTSNFSSCNTTKCTKFWGILSLALIIGFGNAICGWYVANGLYRIKTGDRYVTVKGLAERQVTANLALWTISYKEAGDDLKLLSNKIVADQKVILSFLTAQGLSSNEITIDQTTVNDLYAQDYSSSSKPQQRYVVTNNIKIRTDRVDLIKKASGATSELITQGIVLNKDYGPNPRYLFTKLDSIRPLMLEEATKSARLAAEQFASNSHSHLGKIKHASQGIFQIFSADNSSNQQNYSAEMEQEGSIEKLIRIVSTIDYFLEN